MKTTLILHSLTFQIFVAAAAENPSPPFDLHVSSPLQPPTKLKLLYLAIGSGQQHYVCKQDLVTKGLAWAPHGADATLYDVSKEGANAVQVVNDAGRGPRSTPSKTKLTSYTKLGTHQFTTRDGTLLPSFTIGQSTIVLKKYAAALSPGNPKRNVDWLQLNPIDQTPVTRVYRTTTRGGKVPSNSQCSKNGQFRNEPYMAIYSFWH